MRAIFSSTFVSAALLAGTLVPAAAQDVTSRAEALALIDGGTFRERSNSLGRDIQSSFRRGRWTQSELNGKRLGRSSYYIDRRGRFCRRGQGCETIRAIGRDFALVGRSGRVGKRFRRID